jgi:hypothetical protein
MVEHYLSTKTIAIGTQMAGKQNRRARLNQGDGLLHIIDFNLFGE